MVGATVLVVEILTTRRGAESEIGLPQEGRRLSAKEEGLRLTARAERGLCNCACASASALKKVLTPEN